MARIEPKFILVLHIMGCNKVLLPITLYHQIMGLEQRESSPEKEAGLRSLKKRISDATLEV